MSARSPPRPSSSACPPRPSDPRAALSSLFTLHFALCTPHLIPRSPCPSPSPKSSPRFSAVAMSARCFDVQLIGGMVLYDGKIAEMATGEGKTFVAPLACYMKVLEGYHCHVVTVNDYLVRRDATWVKPAFENLGISVGYIQSEMEP